MDCRQTWIPTAMALLATAILITPAAAEPVGPVVRQAVQFDVSPPLAEVEALPPAAAAPGAREIPLRVVPDLGRPADAPGRADEARQTETRPTPKAAPTPAPLFTFEGLSDDDNAALGLGRIVPPDTEGDIGPNHYVQWINLAINVWTVNRDADGNPTSVTQAPGFPKPGNAIFAGFGGLCETTNSGDPIVLYDHLADRWLASQFAVNGGVIDAQCVAVSTGPDPTGSYFRWEFDVSPGEENDYPKFGLMPDAYYLSTRDFPTSDGTFAGAGAFDRAAMLAGDPSPTFVKFNLPCLANDCPDAIQPPHLEGPPPPAGTPGFFTRAWDDNFDGPLTGSDGYRVWKFVADFAVPSNSTFTEVAFVPGTPYDSTMCGFFQRNCIPQAGVGQTLDPIDELQMYRAQYRHFPGGHDSIVLNTTVDATGGNVAGIRWAELRNADPTASDTWTLFQDGTYAPEDGIHRWMGSAAMDGNGNIALGYSASSSSIFPSIRYTTRLATDPPGTFPGGEVELLAGTGSQTSATRWGDYSTMSVDPAVDCTFWYTQEYYQTTGSFDFNTRVGVLQIPGCGAAGCGDGICDPAVGEDCDTCAADCPSGQEGPACGNGVCEPTEDCLSCAADCSGKQNGNPSRRYCCSGDGLGGGTNPIDCSDSRCGGEGSCQPTPVPGFCCGDLVCDGGDECDACAVDCDGEPICTACVPTAAKEKGPRCSDGLDNDCDGWIDGADPDC